MSEASPSWRDIDANEEKDPLMCGLYIDDIYGYMRNLEVRGGTARRWVRWPHAVRMHPGGVGGGMAAQEFYHRAWRTAPSRSGSTMLTCVCSRGVAR
jgi:hypothetical protein